jgi:TonB family protein
MSQTPIRRVVLAICAGLGATLLLTPARAGSALPLRADTSVRTAWGKQIRAAHECDLRHIEHRIRPALFPTTLPCEYIDTITHADGTLQWDGTDAIAEFLAGAIEGPDVAELQPACDDSAHGDQITLDFGKGKKSLGVIFFPLQGTLQVQDGKNRVGFFDLDHRAGDLLTLFTRSVSRDPRLTTIVPCPGRIDALGVAVARPEACAVFAVEELPVAIKEVKPQYPKESRERDEEGTVLIQALIDAQGRVRRTRIARSVGAFDAYAVNAVEQWQFKPALSKKQPVAVWVAVPVKFSLHD